MRALVLLLFVVGSPGAYANEPAPASAPAPSAVALDQASASQLASLDAIDQDLAERIVAYRDRRGGHLTSVEELRAVQGMTASALESVREGTRTSFSISSGGGRTFDSVEDVMAYYKDEPSVQQIQRWTQEYARASPEMVRAWARASQSFALLPRLQVEYLLDDNLDRRFAYESVGGELQPRQTALDEAQGFRVMVSSQWDLSELVMSSDRIRVINEAQDAVMLRDRLLGQVTRLYFDRRRQQVALLLEPPADLGERVEGHLRLLELTAAIDALTGGRFSQAIDADTP